MQRYYSRHHRLDVLREEQDYNPIFDGIVVGNGLFRDRVTGSAFSQSYTPTNRTVTAADGTNQPVAANTIPIDYVNGEPYVRLEPAAANILLEVLTDWTDTTLTPVKNAVSWAGAANGAYTVTASGADGTLISTAVAGSSAAFTFVVAMKRSVGTGAVSMTIDNGSTWTAKTLTTSFQYFNVTKTAATPQLGFKLATSGDAIIVDCLMLVPNKAIASSYFAPAAAIGAEVIAAQADRDFSAASNWANVSINAYDETGDMTITANAAGQYCQLVAVAMPMDDGKVYRLQFDVANLVGQWQIGTRNNFLIISSTVANGTNYFYFIYSTALGTNGNLIVSAVNTNSSGDFDNFSIKEHGTVRITEANTTTLAIPAAVTAAIETTGVGTVVVKGRFAFARAAGVVTNVLAFEDATASGIYTTTTAGNISSIDTDSNVAASTGAYTANVDWKIAITFPSDTDKYRIGVDADGAGIVQGTEATFSGSLNATANMILGRVLHGATWIKWIKIYDKVLTNAQIDGMS